VKIYGGKYSKNRPIPEWKPSSLYSRFPLSDGAFDPWAVAGGFDPSSAQWLDSYRGKVGHSCWF